MPTYEFMCPICKTTREQFIYHKDYEYYIVRCPKLNCNEPMDRIYSAPAVKFKGTGFYSTGG